MSQRKKRENFHKSNACSLEKMIQESSSKLRSKGDHRIYILGTQYSALKLLICLS